MSDKNERTRDTVGDPEHADDRIGALLRSSGRRPPIPLDRAARIEQATRATWGAMRERRARGRRLWQWTALAAAAVVVAGAGLMLRGRGTPLEFPATIATAEIAAGEVWSRPAAQATAAPSGRLHAGDKIAAGTEITTASDGRVALRLASGHALRLDAGTRVRTLSERMLVLERGAVYVDSGSAARAAAEAIEIRTPLGAVRDIGTQFEVRMLDTSLLVRVREGTVSVAGRGGTLAMEAGEELTLDPAGVAVRGTVDSFGAEWAWSEASARFGDLQGRSLREFLDWYTRERGLRLELAGEGLDAAVGAVMLSGSIEGMTLEQAIDSVLATTSMSREEREGTLRVFRNDVAARP